jgi:uncharacterized protein (TIGR00369 family)
MESQSVIPAHNACFVCGQLNKDGLGLVFERVGDKNLCRARLDSRLQSYEGIVHGGILACIADAAMVNVVYQQCGSRPLTCRLKLRYKDSVHVGEQLVAEASLVRVKHGLAWADCRIEAEGRLCVQATAAFMLGHTGPGEAAKEACDSSG